MVAALYRGYSSVVNNGINTELYDVELVKQDLRNHFMTRLGERVGRPEFGSIIHDLLFEPFDDRTEGQVTADVQRIIASDPRVEPREVRITLDEDAHEITVDIALQYVEFDMEDWFRVEFQNQL